MIERALRRWLLSAGARYAAAILLAALAQLARLPLHAYTPTPFITFVPFMLLGVLLGIGPGVVTAALCVAESVYFGAGPDAPGGDSPRDWLGFAMLIVTGLAANAQFEWMRRSRAAMRIALGKALAANSLLDAVFTAQTDAMVVFNAGGDIIRTNPAAESYFGFEPLGTGLDHLLERFPIDGGRESSMTSRALHGETNICVHQRAGKRTLETSSAPMRDMGGRITGAVTISRDISARKDAEGELLRQRDEKTILLKEVHHRVKNNLAVISSLLSLKADLTSSQEAKAALGESQQRVHSMALVHEHLYGSDQLDRINFADYAQQLVRGLYASLLGDRGNVLIEMNVDPVEIGIERAVPCALILNELLSNALKHAFRDAASGKIAVSCRQAEPGWLTLTVEDNGSGMPPGYLAGGDTKSLGLRIVRILSKQLGGALQQEPCAGTRIVLRFPASSEAREAGNAQASQPHLALSTAG